MNKTHDTGPIKTTEETLKEWKSPSLTRLSQSKTDGKLFNTPGEFTAFSGS